MRNMNKSIKLIFTLCLAFVAFTTVNAQKIGYVNSQEIVSLMPAVKEARSSLETYGQQLQKKAQQMYKALETKVGSLQKKQEEGTLSPKQLEEERIKLQQEEMKLGEFQQSSQMQIAQKEQELLSPILEKVQKAIDEVAKAEGFTIVFDSSQGVILYADQTADISSKVKTKLGL